MQLRILEARARLLRSIRQFLDERGVVEIVTPVMGKTGVPDLHIDSVVVETASGRHYLQTSPEFFMKRLLAAGAGSIYQIGPVFRAGETGRRHNTEFQMLEWYRPGLSLQQLADETLELLGAAFHGALPPASRRTYRELFEQRFGVNPHHVSPDRLREVALAEFPGACAHIDDHGDEGTRNDFLDVLFSGGVEPSMDGVTIVRDFPATQAALAEIHDVDGDRVAKRFECFVDGVEIANAYSELTDGAELRRRFDEQNVMRAKRGKKTLEPDEKLIDAVNRMPVCSGIALGVDRLLQHIVGADSIDEVVSFSDTRL